MSEPPNFGDTLSGGIQEVSALLPLLGTEQCERHVGTALEKGWLFASAAPLSIFGSLGIVKTAFATLLATTTRPFYGGRWLSDAGFGTTGSVSSMVTLVKDTKQYGAEVQLERLMREQHIDDLELVKGVEWFGWRRSNSTSGPDKSNTDGTGSAKSPPFPDISWNASLILSSMILSLVGITPYLYLIHEHWGRAMLWLFPILRSFGSMLLLLMKARRRYSLKLDEAIEDRNTLLELRLHNLREELRHVPDPEKQPDREHLTQLQNMLEPHSLSRNALMILLQALLIAGMAMIVAGYVGCFNMVSRTDVPNGPYVWFGMETGLAVLRIALWGWNPSWDEGDTGMTMQLALRSKDLTSCTPPVLPKSDLVNTPVPTSSPDCHPSDKTSPLQPPSISDIPHFPLITTPQHLSRLTSSIDHLGNWEKENKETFVTESVDNFLASATPYMGPLPRLDGRELEGILLYYAIVPDLGESCERKLLCMTVCQSDSKWTSVSVFINGDNSHTVFTSCSQDLPGTRALRVTLDTKVELDTVAVIDRRTLDLLLDYSFRLFSRLCTTDTNSGNQLALSWNVTFPSSLPPGTIRGSIPLTKLDKEYLRMRQIYDLKGNYCLQRGGLLFGVFRAREEREWGLMLESAVMEVYLCILEHRFVQPISPSPSHLRPLALEWIRGMEDRISLEREMRRRRCGDPAQASELFDYEATYDALVRELRSLRQLHSDSVIIQRWGEFMDCPDQSPSVSDLFALPPLHNLEKLRKALFPLFTVNGQADVPTPAYHKMITHLRSSLSRLSDVRVPSLRNRIDPCGPGSPEFSPPYTRVRQPLEANLSALPLQIDSVQILQLHPWSSNVHDLLRLLDSLSPSPSLTSLLFLKTSFSNEDLPLIPSIVQRHRKIMCVAFDSCGSVDRAHIDRAIAANRRKWKEDTQNGGGFRYSIGWDLNPAKKGNYDAAHMYQNDIILTDRTDVFAMIHIPRPGKITPNLSARPDHHRVVNLIASLRRSDSNSIGEADATYEDHPVSFDLVDPGSLEFETVSVGGFPELATGCYELRIQNSFNFLFRKLTIEFTERPAGEESALPVPRYQPSYRQEKDQAGRHLRLRPGTLGRELGDYRGLSWAIVQHSLRDYEAAVIGFEMFPDPDKHIELCSKIWDLQNTRLISRWEQPFNLTKEVRRLMVERGAQIRSTACKRIQSLITPTFGFEERMQGDEVVRANQKKYSLLATDFGWCYQDPESRTGYMKHPIIVGAICNTLFHSENANGTRSEYAPIFCPIAKNAIAFLCTLIDHCLSKWSSGRYVARDMEESELSPVYNRYRIRIDEWIRVDEVLAREVRMGWTHRGLAHAQSFRQDESGTESGYETEFDVVDSAVRSSSKSDGDIEAENRSSGNIVEWSPETGSAEIHHTRDEPLQPGSSPVCANGTEENVQDESALEGSGTSSEDVGDSSHTHTEGNSGT
ncbi:hypothetical protein AAF712_004466 [Marasmius tenuissimus]|uniref:DUF6532 domain-containing protein n=1 Tax=Marasmius tenuissimus TaxID=585030 RepID=A0ABR3A5W7_9AGAR